VILTISVLAGFPSLRYFSRDPFYETKKEALIFEDLHDYPNFLLVIEQVLVVPLVNNERSARSHNISKVPWRFFVFQGT